MFQNWLILGFFRSDNRKVLGQGKKWKLGLKAIDFGDF